MAEPIKAIFLDRDGTIIEDSHYVRDPATVTLIPGATQALRELREKGYKLFVVSNQAGVGRGIISDTQFKEVHEKVCELLKAENVSIDEFYYCFHHPDDPCQCRKPKTGMVPKSFEGSPIDFASSYTVGDRDSDLELGLRLGTKAVLVRTGKGEKTVTEIESNPRFDSVLKFNDLPGFVKALPTS